MSKELNIVKTEATETVVTVSAITAVYEHPIFKKIENESEREYWEATGVMVRTMVRFGHKALYAITPACSAEEAANMNRILEAMEKAQYRRETAEYQNEYSYDVLLEEGYDPASDMSNPETILMNDERNNAVRKAISALTPEQRNYISIINSGQSERSKSKELGLKQATFHDRKVKTLKELAGKLADLE